LPLHRKKLRIYGFDKYSAWGLIDESDPIPSSRRKFASNSPSPLVDRKNPGGLRRVDDGGNKEVRESSL
jgi:hypothetical protein